MIPLGVEASGDFLTAAAAFLSGMGSVLTGWLALRYERKRGQEDCENRFKAYREGIAVEKKAAEDEVRRLRAVNDG